MSTDEDARAREYRATHNRRARLESARAKELKGNADAAKAVRAAWAPVIEARREQAAGGSVPAAEGDGTP